MSQKSDMSGNGSMVFYQYEAKSPVYIVNGTVIHLQIKEPYRDSQLNELLYVIIVIVFYATALMTLIITQIRRQRREGTDIDYYDEYLQRNQEVKRTCQTAVKVFNKPPPPKSPLPPSVNLPDTPDTPTNGGTEGGGGGIDVQKPRTVQRERSPIIQRDRSPMLESIPDEEPTFTEV